MRHFNILVAAMIISGLTTTMVFAADITGTDRGEAQIKNVQTGARNLSTGWTEIFDGVAATEGQAKNTGEKVTAVIAGVGIGTGKALRKTGAGIVDLGTFWMPKRDPLLNPTKAKDDKQVDASFSSSGQNFGPRLDRR